ncbi:hypothetical protein P175DRAFT_0503212 [Aspergillus ochraceoroseus IBT 24754]|uniref:Uncharacterized protein n=1 Tax=Aspergillus ochraceoroseus IBT 24754 TaxID=1392256 RepID=A0A2T5LTR8_9EURO|nr:uncharacterized protein P175DRAFT_0503212 [Aspergillus ochraceoroseus IBT 24754]PTU19668.1 hypothetical protein P175DRAFT_0503212 [Aspergillus ochraceoroseus IBT 24754]
MSCRNAPRKQCHCWIGFLQEWRVSIIFQATSSGYHGYSIPSAGASDAVSLCATQSSSSALVKNCV